MDREPSSLGYWAGAIGRPVSAFAVVACVLAVLMLPCVFPGMAILTLVPADVFNGVDFRYRKRFWDAIAGVPAAVTLVLNIMALRRVEKRKLTGRGCAIAGIVISSLWLVLDLVGGIGVPLYD